MSEFMKYMIVIVGTFQFWGFINNVVELQTSAPFKKEIVICVSIVAYVFLVVSLAGAAQFLGDLTSALKSLVGLIK